MIDQDPSTLPKIDLQALQMGLHEPSRTIFLIGDTDEGMFNQAIKLLHALDRTGCDPITVELNSPGGSVYQGMAIYDSLLRCQSPIIIIGSGEVSSMASVILQAGDIRLLTPSTFLTIHHASVERRSKMRMEESLSDAKDCVKIENRSMGVLAERMGKTMAEFREWCRIDRMLSAREAVKLGLADDILKTKRGKR